MPTTTDDRAVLLATIDAMMLRMIEQEGTLRRQRLILRMAATRLRTGAAPHTVLALLLEQEPDLGPPLTRPAIDHAG